MRTFLTVSLLSLVVFIGFSTNAEAYVNPGSCTILNRNLAVGSQGADVSDLQRFLVAQDYPGGGSWMITGYYGQATRVAVQNLQVSTGLSQTGIVDSATRNAIQQYSCGGGQVLGASTSYYSPYNNNYYYDPYSYSYNYYNPYNSGGLVLGATTNYYNPYTYYTTPTYNSCTYYNCANQSISISYITPTVGGVGDEVDIYGTGFSESNNTVHFGSGIVPFVRSANNGTVLSFTVPTNLQGYGSQTIQNQTYDVYVTNEYGQNSNRASFTVSGSAGTGNRPWVSNISGPASVDANESHSWSLTVHGPESSIAKINVIWGDEYQSGSSGTSEKSVYIGSSGSATVSFTHTYKVNGNYSPTFIASNGYGSNSSTQSVIVGNGGVSGSVVLNSLSPNSGQRGSQVILYGSGFSAYDNVIHFSYGGLRNVASVANGTALYFTVPHYISPCDTVVGSCNTSPIEVTAGSYPIYVTNSNGTTQTLNFTVTN